MSQLEAARKIIIIRERSRTGRDLTQALRTRQGTAAEKNDQASDRRVTIPSAGNKRMRHIRARREHRFRRRADPSTSKLFLRASGL